MLFKKEEEKITNSTQIKEILDKSKDISTKDEMLIMSYIYDLENYSNELEQQVDDLHKLETTLTFENERLRKKSGEENED